MWLLPAGGYRALAKQIKYLRRMHFVFVCLKVEGWAEQTDRIMQKRVGGIPPALVRHLSWDSREGAKM